MIILNTVPQEIVWRETTADMFGRRYFRINEGSFYYLEEFGHTKRLICSPDGAVFLRDPHKEYEMTLTEAKQLRDRLTVLFESLAME